MGEFLIPFLIGFAACLLIEWTVIKLNQNKNLP
jgi:hypothetical protein